MKQREAYDKYNALLEEVIETIREFISKDKEEVVDFAENGFEDEAGNDLEAIDNDQVWFNNMADSYPLHELGLLDAIKIMGDFEAGVIGQPA